MRILVLAMAVHSTSEVHDLVCDTSYDESQFQTDGSSSSDSESDFDLSDPGAESQQLSQDDLQDYDMPSPDGQSDEDEESRDGESVGDDNPDIVSDCNSRCIGSTRGNTQKERLGLWSRMMWKGPRGSRSWQGMMWRN